MNLAEWRARQQEGEAFTLPSGLEVRLKKVALMDLAQAGQIPTTLRAPVAEILKRRPDQTVDLADVEKFGHVLDVVCKACIVEPAELKPEELPSYDKQAIFNWANQVAGRLEPFRHQPNGNVESSFTVGDLSPATK
jgi:hypothetical protein